MMMAAACAQAADKDAIMGSGAAGHGVGNAVTAATASTTSMPIPGASPSEPPVLTQELIDLIQAHKLVELRTIYNGSFAATMFFNPQTLEYYTALLKGHTFWWISKTGSADDAEKVYTKLATQTIRLAAPELAKIQLDARIAVARKQLEEAQTRQSNLMQQVNAQNSIVQQGTAAQAQLAEEAGRLSAQREQLQKQLAATQNAINSLEQQALKGPDIGADAATAALSSSTPASSAHSQGARRQ
jgi:hypothetical protein